jgi:predicted XRE-type DNA-binding protein
MPERAPWIVDVYETEQGERPALRFLQGLQGRNEAEAVALVKLLQERGNSLRRPQSGALGEGLFELRGKEVRSREDAGTRARVPEGSRAARACEQAGEGAVSKKTAVMEWIDERLKADPGLAREVDEILSGMRLEQDLAALRERRKLTQRQVAKLLGTSQPYVAKLESGRVKNLGIGTLVKYAQALGGTVTVRITPRPHPVAARRTRLKKAG